MMMLSAARTSVGLQAKLFRGFGDASRLALLHALRDGPRTVTELVAATGLSQSNASNHLACLRDCALVRAEPKGRQVRYSISNPEVHALLRTAEKMLERVASDISDCANYGAPRGGRRGE